VVASVATTLSALIEAGVALNEKKKERVAQLFQYVNAGASLLLSLEYRKRIPSFYSITPRAYPVTTRYFESGTHSTNTK
jgi:hypothetical protein